MTETASTSDDWTEIIAGGEKAIYVSEDGSREVTVIRHRFTPKGLMYDLVPEKDSVNSRWTVASRVLQPMHGFTRTILVNLVTGEERSTAFSSPMSVSAGDQCATSRAGVLRLHSEGSLITVDYR